MALHPDAQAFLAKMGNAPQPQDIPIEEFRRAASALIPTGPSLKIGTVSNLEIAGGDGQPMQVRVYVPEGAGPFPMIVWAHGGSFIRGTLDLFDAGRRAFTKASNCIVVAVDQRLSPEARFPAPLEDVYAALQWTAGHARELGGGVQALIGVAGESSGGNLAAAVTLLARDRGGPAIDFQLLIEPILDARCDTTSMHELAEGYVLTRQQLLWAYQQYAPGVEANRPLLSPLLAKDLSGLPPAVVVTIEYDPARDEGEGYAAALAAAGVRVLSARIPGMLHHFPGPDLIPTAAKLLRELLQQRTL
jgi:acetyl esterase/lipase